MSNEQKKVKASEKLSMLEEKYMVVGRRVGEMELILYNISRENEILKDALQLIHEKLEAVISLSNDGAVLTSDNINDKVTSLKEQDLKNKVDQMLEKGAIETTEEIGENSFVVSRELNKEGQVINPRLQFLTSRLSEELQSKFVGKRAGDLVVGEEDRLDIEIAEIYNFVEQKLDPKEELPSEEASQDEEATE